MRDHEARDRAGARKRRARSTTASSTPRRPAASSTGCTATKSPPSLWRKVMKGLSAGRVQSVATRLVVERERERIEFRAAEYWDIVATFAPGEFDARLTAVDGRKVAQGRDFARTGELVTADAVQLRRGGHRPRPRRCARRTRPSRRPLGRAQALHAPPRRPVHDFDAPAGGEPQAPLPPRSTRCGSPRDSTRTAISPTCVPTHDVAVRDGGRGRRATRPARSTAPRRFPDAPRQYNRKVKNAQEAHEAIRPAGDSFRLPWTTCAVRSSATRPPLYELVWKRTVASQMADARGETVLACASAAPPQDGRDAEFGTAGTVITFRGFMLAYEEGRGRSPSPRTRKSAACRRSTEGDELAATALEARVALDDPAAAIHRGDARARARRARNRPTVDLRLDPRDDPRPRLRAQGGPGARADLPRLFAVTGTCSSRHFGRLVDYGFTAAMEDDLDGIAAGDEQRTAWLRRFYFGDEPAMRRD